MEQRKLTLPALFQQTVQSFGDRKALTFVYNESFTYNQVKDNVFSLIDMLQELNISKGDRVAILSENTPYWGLAYYAVTFMGAVAVPILPDFSDNEIENILEHSEAKAIFISDKLLPKIAEIKNDFLLHRIKIDTYSIYDNSNIAFSLKENYEIVDFNVQEDDLLVIIYTSGTTGKSKGVMLTHKNESVNAIGAGILQPVDENDRFLSILPLSHTYENTLGLVLPMANGACVYYLKQVPSPTVLIKAMEVVKPTLILSVPLVIEKIVRNKVFPKFNKGFAMKNLYKVPFIRKGFNKLAGKKLHQTFGGELKFFGIGGAKLDKKVEAFLLEAKFPIAIGYGLTETAPLIAGTNPSMACLQTTGPAISEVSIKINDPDPKTKEGEIWAKGPNVMKGYYKDEDLTKEVITEDGWFKTGDLGTIDERGYLYIRGRLKNMIIGASGENIYPEEIESIINDFNFVSESIVVEQKGKLVAMVHFNLEELEKKYNSLRDEMSGFIDRKIDELKKELHIHINANVSKFSRIHSVVYSPIPFKKTATKKIKRYLYFK